MHKAILGAALVSALALSVGMALAHDGGNAERGRHGDRGFSMLDTDKDGMITKAEFAVGRDKMFQRLDADGDGAFTRDEAAAGAAAWHKKAAESGKTASPEREARHKERAGKMFNDIDADKDGKITKVEFDAAGEKMFARLDANGDGSLAKGEGRHARPAMQPPARQ